jgi:hypothetical protein
MVSKPGVHKAQGTVALCLRPAALDFDCMRREKAIVDLSDNFWGEGGVGFMRAAAAASSSGSSKQQRQQQAAAAAASSSGSSKQQQQQQQAAAAAAAGVVQGAGCLARSISR